MYFFSSTLPHRIHVRGPIVTDVWRLNLHCEIYKQIDRMPCLSDRVQLHLRALLHVDSEDCWRDARVVVTIGTSDRRSLMLRNPNYGKSTCRRNESNAYNGE